MKTFSPDQLIEAQAHQPQIERFVGADKIRVVETPADYAKLPPDLRAMLEAREGNPAA